MVNYECQRCGYQTINKSYFRKHLLRKNICFPRVDNISRYDILILNNFKEEAKIHKSNPESNPNGHLKSNYICRFCNKKYKYKQGRWKHEQTCKSSNNNKDLIIEELKTNIEELKKTVEELMLKIPRNNELKVNINKANRDINTTNNVQINNYGAENIDYITDKVFKKLLQKPVSAITRLIELKHFHPHHPENHNIKITNIHDKYAKIYQDKKWLIKHKKDVVEDLVENGYADFEEFKDLNEDELAEKIKEKYILMQKNYNNNFEKICQKSELAIINETKSFDI